MFLDIGVGILLAILTSKLFNLTLTIPFVIIGIVFALLPDIDCMLLPIKKWSSQYSHKHRDLLHYPLLYIFTGVLILLFFNKTLAVLFGLCSLMHFIHDSIGIGWGIQWLYPFSKNHYSFFNIYQPKHKEKIPKAFLHVWKDEEMDVIAEKYGDKNWFKNIYLHLHPYAIFEFLIFIIAIIILYKTL